MWHKISPLNRGLIIFFLVNYVAITGLQQLFLETRGQGYLHSLIRQHPARYLLRGPVMDTAGDSLLPMYSALQYLKHPQEIPVYAQLFSVYKLKFQYPPTSLLVFQPFRECSLRQLAEGMGKLSWVATISMLIVTAAISFFSTRSFRGIPRESRFDTIAGILLALLFSAGFYPLLRSLQLGQIQTFITLFVSVAVLAYLTGHRWLSGICISLASLVKPHYLLLLVWGGLRKRWKFTAAFFASFLAAAVLSVSIYGFSNHLDYLNVLTYISRHGESFYANQSVNGLLHRMIGNGNNLNWEYSSFPPYNKFVYAGTVLSSSFLLLMALFWRPFDRRNGGVIDFLIMALSVTIASPIAWEHHYGILPPIYAVALPATMKMKKGKTSGLILLAISFVLTSNYYPVTDYLADTPLNFLQSYVFFGAVLLLIHLYRLKKIKPEPEAAHREQEELSPAAVS